jgi:hypothetical protein
LGHVQVAEAVQVMLEVLDASDSAMQAPPSAQQPDSAAAGASAAGPGSAAAVLSMLLDALIEACTRGADGLSASPPAPAASGASSGSAGPARSAAAATGIRQASQPKAGAGSAAGGSMAAGAAGFAPGSARRVYLINCLAVASGMLVVRRSAGGMLSTLAAASDQHLR